MTGIAPRLVSKGLRELLYTQSAVVAARSFSSNVEVESHKHKANSTPAELLKRKRVQGFGRKVTLRAINRNIIHRLAKRATIGIPLLGMYFALRVLKNDITEATNTENPLFIRNIYKLSSAINISDVMAQTVMISSMVSTVLLPDLLNMLPQLADLNSLTPMADKVSLAAALTSSCFGTYCEIKKEELLEAKEEEHAP
ncbi:hypothetical protein EON65_01830 [archaeon]|nr:MAG: hypothetical protein EON65_01830 [archaeon]